jgi:hypothetical protein
MRRFFSELHYTFRAVLGGWPGCLLLAGIAWLAWMVDSR